MANQRSTYFFRLLQDGKAVREIERLCNGDLDALNEAQFMAEKFDVEVWEGKRRVVRCKKGNVPSSSADPFSG